MGEFDGKVVVVTGASRGLGLGCAEAFAARGAEVVMVSRGEGELEAAAARIRGSGGKALARPCDVTDPAAVAALFDALPRCDVLVNNAGGNRPMPFLDVPLETLDHLLDLNVRSMFVTAQAAARAMVRGDDGGAIVHMSSQMGHVGAPNRTVYCMTKWAIEGLTKAMAVELAPRRIRVNAVAPTYIETPMTKPFFENAAFREDTLRRIPLGRIGSIDEVAAAVVFLASPAAGLITGSSLLIDGGYTAQ
ncbi:MAG: SDR family oxidoreductase [Steroidobacteraceae bacterium]|jgi:NAD(P)-dependent dehydrogenase (short-subunit alcohol dehydrogenase family)|nr:SDR family oxidoreductase [Steroidobacteraceae bacterium]